MLMQHLPANIQSDIDAVNKIPIIASMLEVICQTTGMGFSAIAKVTDEKWIACCVRDEISFGLQAGGELLLQTTICNEIRQHHQPVIIDHVAEDELFNAHPTPAMYGFQSYISMPIIRKDGSFFGTICAIDPKPAKLKETHVVGMFKMFAELISFHLNAIEELEKSEANLVEERKIAELREQFIAILGHDLRNPIGAIIMGADILKELAGSDASGSLKVASTIKNSAYRISGLIDNMLDFARGRMGGGIELNYNQPNSLETILNQIVHELQMQHPDSKIQSAIHLPEKVVCDESRIGQLFSNLLGNAITHSFAGSLIQVNASIANSTFILTVSNQAEDIPAPILNNLFQPFYRGNDTSGKKGLGLGLYIACEIAKAHHGKLYATSDNETITFSLEIPVLKP